ncbi:hypothetical protein FYJ85_10900 [Victivallaceae bacterium BBE-744-WT-12]|uniref:Type II secretion system protein GspC N-terminal domain-containing protein n=1 Tax=Victivallis lenta TaxID=2606640 RepID=A0A844G2F1_9BACT|nr:hypothetical protein [Victivallis lenta]MST97546.1 hypothetical protein [Victivallis lenta]
MKTRWIVLLADGLLALALAFALLALASGKPARTGETFELPASPATAGVGRHGPIAAELSGGNLFHPLRGAAVPAEQEKAAAKPSARPPAAGKFELTGIFSFGDARGVIITGAEQPQAAGKKPVKPKQLYREGDPVGGGYVVRKIEKDQAVLMRGSEKTVLLLHKKQEKKP